MALLINDDCTACDACVEECPNEASTSGIPIYVIDPNKCTGCTLCARKCPVSCIAGKVKEPHVIDQSKCIKCGACMDNCKFGAISKK